MFRRRSASCRSPTASSWRATPSNTGWTNRRIRVVLLIRRASVRCDDGAMTAPHDAVVSRLSANFASMSAQFAKVSADLTELDRLLSQRPNVPQPAPHPVPPPMYIPQPHQPYAPPAAVYAPPPPPPPPPAMAPPPRMTPPPAPPREPRPPRDSNWIGKVLAVAGVAVTLIGVVLLLVLAAQAGILRPEIRVGAGAVLAGALVVVAFWLNGRPGGRVGAIALSATGIAAAYIDIIAVTTIYGWVPGAVGLGLAAVVAGGGLMVARRWNSEHLALLVLVPLLGLGPVVVGDIPLLLVGFMLPLSIALVAMSAGPGRVAWLAAACAVATLLALLSALVLLPNSSHPIATALFSAAGTLPVLAVSLAVNRVT